VGVVGEELVGLELDVPGVPEVGVGSPELVGGSWLVGSEV
jgi:hypothetical protein